MQPPATPRTPGRIPPRIWPAVTLLALLLALRWLPGLLPGQSIVIRLTHILGPPSCVPLILLWWLFFSRIPIRERLLGLGGLAVIVVATVMLSHPSMSAGFGIIGSVIPWGTAAFVVGFLVAHRLGERRRTGIALLAALLGFGFWTLVRAEGVWGDFTSEYHWR